jgi:uncharacterized protein YegP (UPF0339 family)
MPMFRIVTRKTSISTPDRSIFIDSIFGTKTISQKLDLNLSMYEVNFSERVQIGLEHVGAIPLTPDAAQGVLDLSSFSPQVKISEDNSGKYKFSLRASSHRELNSTDEDTLRKFAEEAFDKRDSCMHSIDKLERELFLHDRFKNNDPEWRSVFDENKNWKKLATKPTSQT